MDRQIVPVVLSGGAGTRLWPLSRTFHPKQFLKLDDSGYSLLAATLRRHAAPGFAPPMVICHMDHRFLVAEELRVAGFADAPVILEPEGRNTAPAAILAALVVARKDPNALLLLTPSDHTIGCADAYRTAAVEPAAAGAAAGALVTFGIVPTRAETGYGYMRRRDQVCAPGCYWLDRFVEKPDEETAARFVADGNYLWNSGMFLCRADSLLEEAARFAPLTLDACRAALDRARPDGCFLWLEAEAYQACPSEPIDTAIMERTDRAAVVPVDIGWNDVGSWQSLWESCPKDGEGNAVFGDVLPLDTRGSCLWAPDVLLATVGVEDLVVVATRDAVLVCPRDRSQDVKRMVAELKRQTRPESDTHVLVRRPWGAYESLSRGDRFQVKRLIVNPGRRLSVQLHYHRSEHWVVVRGTARIFNGEAETLLFENQSTYIPAGSRHRLENPGLIPLELIEVQSGSYLGEDDIVRFQDDFGRN